MQYCVKKNITEAILREDVNYLLSLKKDQSSLNEDIRGHLEATLKDCKLFDVIKENRKLNEGHGRIKKESIFFLMKFHDYHQNRNINLYV